ncbi:MAG: restriction endonuclease subunit S [Christensenellales bacterium]
MTAEQLRKSILQLAIQGKLVKQSPQDEPASVLLERIRKEKEYLIKEGKIKRDKQDSIILKGDDNCYYEKIGKTIENIDDEIPFDIPYNWSWCRFSMITQINGGFAFKSINYVDHNKGIRVLRISDFDENGFRNNKNVYHQYLETLEPYLLEKNDIIMCMTGGTVGKSLLIKSLTEPMLVNQRVATIKLSNGIIPLYAYAFIQSGHIKNIINKSKNSTNDNISMDLLKSLIFPLPPLAEQARIIERLEKLESLIEKYDALEKQATKLDSEIKDKLRKSILQYAIQGKLVPQDKNDEPASMLLEHIRKEKKAHLGKKYVESYIYKGDDNCYYEKIGNKVENITDNIPFDIPNSWEWTKVDSILHVNPRNKIPDETEASFIAMKSIKEGFCNDFVFESKYWKNIKKGFTHFKDKDVGFAKITPCFQNRKSVIFRNLKNGVGAGTTELHVLRPIGDTVSSEYLLWFVKTPYFINYGISKFAGTAGQQRFTTVDLKDMAIPLPPYPEQIRIIKRINLLFHILN